MRRLALGIVLVTGLALLAGRGSASREGRFACMPESCAGPIVLWMYQP